MAQHGVPWQTIASVCSLQEKKASCNAYPCDLRKQACGQCVRAGLACSGYRDPNQLIIRDESELTRQKVVEGRSGLKLQTIQVPIEEIAKAAFFSHYVNGLAKTYDVIERIAKQAPLAQHLAASVDAASLAFLHFQHYSMRAARCAQEKYLSALPQVNRALGSPDLVTHDSTLLAVLLLDLFEKIMNSNARSSKSWLSHVNGALALVKVRGTRQFQTYIGLRLSVRLFTNMLISCVAANVPVPPALTKLRRDIERSLRPNDPKWQVSGLVIEYTNLRVAIQDGCLTPPDLIAQAKALDDKFSSLAATLPPSWVYRRVPMETQSNMVLERYYDVYPSCFTAQTCNVIRLMRILLNETIRSTYMEISSDGADTRFTDHIRSSTQTIDDMAREICAAGPQYTGFEDTPRRIDEFSPVRKLHCYTLLYPFYVAGLCASPGSGTTEWIVHQLRSMATSTGIKNASLVADMLTGPERPAPWTVYALLGSYAFAA